MSRAVRIEFDGAYYHVMSRGVARMPTFLDDEDRRRFLAIIGELVDRGDFEVHAFCLMPHYYHLLVCTPHGGLSRWMRHVNGDYVRWFNIRHRRVGHLWQGRYKAILVQDAAYLRECSRYIHLNPNRSKLTRPAQRYRWSSYRNDVGGPTAALWVQTRLVLGEFAGDRERYRAYVESGKGEKLISPFEQAVAGLVLGGEEFVARIRTMLRGRRDTHDPPSLRALRSADKLSPEIVEAAVDRVFPSANPARKRRLRLYALRLYSRLRATEIARRCGRSHGAVFLAVRDLNAEARRDPILADAMKRLADDLGEKPIN